LLASGGMISDRALSAQALGNEAP